MTNKIILIDAAHREETRIAVVENGILQDFDREAFFLKQIKGNIYLAKVIRVEPSLQACFVDYGYERHGFLPFADIHPDFFQIPEIERQSLKDLNTSHLASQTKNEEEESTSSSSNQNAISASISHQPNQIETASNPNHQHKNSYSSHSHENEDSAEESITTGSYSVEEETSDYKGNIHSIYRRYQIQDVIKPGQLILVQAMKEERGNKGASMTTYISIAGKYCVLMANTPNKGGVSKKVDNIRDRKILRSILGEISLSSDRSVIIRTAGVGKKPEDIKRDCEYLNRLWDSIKEASSTSSAPTFIHAEDDAIRRCIRDVYNETVSEVIVEGNEAYETVVNFVKLTMPGFDHNIRLHDEKIPVFNKHRVEQQISALYDKQIALPSGGSVVIDHTEALVAIDVNSGRATKEIGVEETAYATNLEAVKEIARQLRLRDLAGLIVIDFIDMYDQRNRRNIERTLRDELQHDRARIQFGRISVFGLLEMSRQRLGASFFETITEPCKNCAGTGYVRSVEILAVTILRAIRHSCFDRQTGVVYLYARGETIAYILNFKRNDIIATEKSFNVIIITHINEDVGAQGFLIKKRKSLSDEERLEFEMNIKTGKVNQLGIEKAYFENIQSDHESENLIFSSESKSEKPRNQNHRNENNQNRNDELRNSNHRNRFEKGEKQPFDRRRGNNRNPRRDDSQNRRPENQQKSASLISSLLSIFKK